LSYSSDFSKSTSVGINLPLKNRNWDAYKHNNNFHSLLLISRNFVRIIFQFIQIIMKKITTVLLLIVLCIPAFCQKDNTIKWQPSPLKIDGNGSDWLSRPQNFDNNTKLAFEMRNDAVNLYLEFQITDTRTQFKIARAGMSLTLEIKTKPKHKADIYVSPFIKEKPGEHKPNQGDKKGPSVIKQKYLLSPPDMLASGFTFTNDDISSYRDEKKIMFIADWDSLNCMTIEVQIPLRELFGDHFDLPKVSADDISLSFEEKAMERPTPSGEGNPGGGEHQGGGQGGFQHNNSGGFGQQSPGGGSHQYGGEGQGNADRTSMFEAQIVKQKFKLNPGKK
jgi:hypothetical protein